MSRSNGPGFIVGALVGGALGAGLAIIFAPRSGEETRRGVAAWRNEETPAAGVDGTTEVFQLGQALLKQALRRVDQASRAARQAREAASVQLVQEWNARKGDDSPVT